MSNIQYSKTLSEKWVAMKQMKKSIKILSIFTLFWTLGLTASAQNLRCYIIDAQTGDSIPFASAVYVTTKLRASSDAAGILVIGKQIGQTLTVTAVGYNARRIKITSNIGDELTIKLISQVKRLEGVVVKAKRKRKYTRKNNPAVELMRRVIAAKKHTNLSNYDYYQFEKYQKLTMGINNITPEELEKGIFKKHPFLINQVEVCPYNLQMILPISVDETLTKHIYRKNPNNEKDIIKAQDTRGISKLLQTGATINVMAKDIFKDIDLYDDNIELLHQRFPSPIGSAAISFYHYYIDDTTYVDQDKCIRLQFMPANQQDFGFRGELYILADSSLHVRKCVMQLPANTGVNFVQSMKFEQEFKKLPNNEWVMTVDNLVAELRLTKLLERAIAIRSTRLDNYSFDPIDKAEFKGKAALKYDPNAKMRSKDYWAKHRKEQLSKGEADIDNFVHNVTQMKSFKWIIFATKTLIENFIETGSHNTPSKIDIGPINTIISKNYADGYRFRASARTTAHFNPHWFFEGYYAYGTKSHNHYYDAKVTYSFNKPEYLPIEFPIQTLSFESNKDVESPSDKFLIHNKDNFFMAFRPVKVEKMYFFNRQKINFKWETDYGLASSIEARTESNRPTGDLIYQLMDGSIVNNIRRTEFTLGFDYRPGQSYINTKQNRLEVNLDAPQFTLKHTIGVKNFLGGNFTSNLTEFTAYKRLWLGSWGNIDARLIAGVQWNKVPFPLLIMPPINTSYFENQWTFSMMNNMEFLNDRYAMFSVAWNLQGKILNRIPLIKKLKWREYIGIKGMWGHLSNKNNPLLPENANNPALYRFPEGTYIMTHDPYMELVVGVYNIFKVLQVNYVRRLTYTGMPGVHKNGIRFGFNLVF